MFGSFVHFSTGLFIFLLLGFKSSLYNMDTSPLLDMCFTNVSSKFVAYLFITYCFLPL